jgi:hypothetical protein
LTAARYNPWKNQIDIKEGKQNAAAGFTGAFKEQPGAAVRQFFILGVAQKSGHERLACPCVRRVLLFQFKNLYPGGSSFP